MVQQYQEPPREFVTLPPLGCHRAPPGPSQATLPSPFIRHQDSLNKELHVFAVENAEITKHETPVGLTHWKALESQGELVSQRGDHQRCPGVQE